uniref:Venom polypeptide n=1 Tax=Dolopus genitalis TaxID=2488630 RepID=A0A3G5BIH2_DOLGE|nr:venom polypeptide [Dolopus genitalis]
MKYLAFIFFACALQSIYADSIQDAIQQGNERIAQLKSRWQNEIAETENIILPEIDALAAQFAEVAAHVAKQVKDDAGKVKAAENVKVAFDAFIAEAKKSVSKIANARPDVLEKAFSGAKVASYGYGELSKMVSDLKQAAAGNTCKEAIVAKLVELAAKQVNEVTECVLKGGDNFPVPPTDVLQLRTTAQQVTKDIINMYNRCSEEVGTICFDNLVENLKKETQNAVKNGDSYVDAPHAEVDMQKHVSKFCVKSKAGFLKRQAPQIKGKMDQC